jgi:hypothetical protein
MALRLYPLRGGSVSGLTIGVTIFRGSWDTGGSPQPFLMSLDKADESSDGAETSTSGVGSPGPIDDSDDNKTFVYELPQNMSLSGTLDICIPALGDSRYVENLKCHAYVTTGVTGGVRGTLLSNYEEPSGTNDIPDAATAVSFDAPQAITSVNGLAGDYIVVEIGFVFRGPAPNNGGVNSYHGCKSTGSVIVGDLVVGDLYAPATNSGAAWIEFALVPTPIPVDDSDPDCCTTAPGQSSGVDTDATSWTPTCAGGGAVPTAATPATAESWAA